MKVGVVGASGYVGGELLRLLVTHPKVEVNMVTSRQKAGEYVHRVHPSLKGFIDITFSPMDMDKLASSCDLVFTSVPHGKANKIVKDLYDRGMKVIDLSADFRLKNPKDYVRWYGWEHPFPEMLSKSVYGVPELHREEIKKAQLVSCPGCMAVTSLLALKPLIENNLIDTEHVVVDSKIGSSGAGQKANAGTHHAMRYGVVRPYKPAKHRHTGEIEQELSAIAKKQIKVSMSPHAVNIVRGILTTNHTFLKRPVEELELWKMYRNSYKGEPFVRLIRDKKGLYKFPDPKFVVGSNFCDVGFDIDEYNQRIVALSASDNLMKGAAGSAIQVMSVGNLPVPHTPPRTWARSWPMRRRALVLSATFVAGLALTGAADAARFAVGLTERADARAVAAAIERRTGARPESLAPIPALVVDVPAGVSLAGIGGVRYVEPVVSRRLALTPTDPLVSKQWYLTQSRFYESWLTLPALEPIPVAVIDSGVDSTHPELAGDKTLGTRTRILDAKSFVGGSAKVDTLGHGTFVAGLIAAAVDNGVGIAGLAPSAELLIAKVVTKSRAISVESEARAIRWAVDAGARVINMSLGGLRDPIDPSRDSYSRLEADAVAYAVSEGVVVVAAVGNGDQAPTSPWQYASYPAALPHVLGVSATTQSGGIPKFSNRDRIYNDLAAPGEQILSIFPRPLTARYPTCSEQGYSSCGPDDYREAQGTSFAAPQVSAAAAVLLSLRPTLWPEQVTGILERTALDLHADSGCTACELGRDALSGWGRLDVVAAITALDLPPPRDRYEANDDAGSRAYPLSGSNRRIKATVDFWDDQDDVYAVRLRKRQRVYVGLTGGDPGMDLNLALWLPQTRRIERVTSFRFRARFSARAGSREYFSYRAPAVGTYFVQVRMSTPGTTGYRLAIVKS